MASSAAGVSARSVAESGPPAGGGGQAEDTAQLVKELAVDLDAAGDLAEGDLGLPRFEDGPQARRARGELRVRGGVACQRGAGAFLERIETGAPIATGQIPDGVQVMDDAA